MSKLLDRSRRDSVMTVVMDALDAEGYEPHEVIPGLVDAIYVYAEGTSLPEQALDEAANLLADGPGDEG